MGYELREEGAQECEISRREGSSLSGNLEFWEWRPMGIRMRRINKLSRSSKNETGKQTGNPDRNDEEERS
jgi:hypothetical protein